MESRRNFLKRSLAVLALPSLEVLAGSDEKKIVVIDAGHGMKHNGVFDSGALVYDHSGDEAHIILPIANYVGVMLEEVARRGQINFDVRYTRTDNVTPISNEDRINFSNGLGAHLYVSVHANYDGGIGDNRERPISAEDARGSARGARTYCYPTSINGREARNFIQSSLIKILEKDVPEFRQDGDGLKENDKYRVLKDTHCPAVLVETDFVSNPKSAKLLQTHGVYYAKGIALGICEYFDNKN